jgi:hypothetical protein
MERMVVVEVVAAVSTKARLVVVARDHRAMLEEMVTHLNLHLVAVEVLRLLVQLERTDRQRVEKEAMELYILQVERVPQDTDVAVRVVPTFLEVVQADRQVEPY